MSRRRDTKSRKRGDLKSAGAAEGVREHPGQLTHRGAWLFRQESQVRLCLSNRCEPTVMS